MSRQSSRASSVLKFGVTLLVAVPLFVVVGWPHSWHVSLAIAFVSIGAGHLAAMLYDESRNPTATDATRHEQEPAQGQEQPHR